MHPISSFFGRRLVQNSFFLFAGTLLFDEKIRQSAALFQFRQRTVGILQIFYLRAVLQTKCIVPAFLGVWFGGKDCGLCIYNRHVPKKQDGQMDFCMKRLRTLNSYKIQKLKIVETSQFSLLRSNNPRNILLINPPTGWGNKSGNSNVWRKSSKCIIVS